MSNYNIRIALTKLKGAKVMEIEGRTCTRKCVVIPIDNEEGTVQDCYEAIVDGVPTMKPLDDVQLQLTAFEYRERKYGQTHGIKAAFSKKRLQSMAEEVLKTMPFIGNLKPWSMPKDDDLPPADKDW